MTIDLDSVDLADVRATMDTDKGRMEIRFRPDKAPRTVRNFLDLAQKGFYDGLVFHRIIKDFMIQGGCPEGTGMGGPGYTIEAEFNDIPHERGVLSMARSRHPDSAGSQFFIVHADHAGHLDGLYTAFAEVVEGLDVLDAIASVETTFGPGGERSQPTQPLGIRKLTVGLAGAGADDAEAGGGGA